MSDVNDINGLAGEYVLGTLDEAERADVESRRQTEPELAAAIHTWEKQFLPLALAAPEQQPSLDVWNNLVKRVFGFNPNHMIVVVKRAERWRRIALAACLLAVLGTGMNFYSYHQGVVRTDVALLQKNPAPMFMVSMNEQEHSFTVHMKGGAMPTDKSYQLWLIIDDKTPPMSMGVLKSSRTVLHPSMPDMPMEVVRQATLAISLEPMGGSPTGLPTGEVVSSGKFLAI